MRLLRLLAAVVLTFGTATFQPIAAHAQVGPNGFVCMVGNVPANQINGSPPFWAMSIFAPYPTIIYGSTFYQLDGIMQHFTQLHECGHLSIPTSNEFLANCFALQRMSNEGTLTPETLAHIRAVHYSLGALPPQYGGSGAGFWQATFSSCPALAGAL